MIVKLIGLEPVHTPFMACCRESSARWRRGLRRADTRFHCTPARHHCLRQILSFYEKYSTYICTLTLHIPVLGWTSARSINSMIIWFHGRHRPSIVFSGTYWTKYFSWIEIISPIIYLQKNRGILLPNYKTSTFCSYPATQQKILYERIPGSCPALTFHQDRYLVKI